MGSRIYSIVTIVLVAAILVFVTLGNFGQLPISLLACSAVLVSAKKFVKENMRSIISIISIGGLISALSIIAITFLIWNSAFIGRIIIPNLVSFLIYALSVGTVIMTFDNIKNKIPEVTIIAVSVICSLIALFNGANCTIFTVMYACALVLFAVSGFVEGKLHKPVLCAAIIEAALGAVMFIVELSDVRIVDVGRYVVLIIDSIVLLAFSFILSTKDKKA